MCILNSFPALPWLRLFFQIDCFLNLIQSVSPIFVTLCYNRFLYISDKLSGLLCQWIFDVPEVALNLAFLSIVPGLAALMCTDDIAQNLWSLASSYLNSCCTFYLFPLLTFFRSVACFLHWFNLLTPFFTLCYNGSLDIFINGKAHKQGFMLTQFKSILHSQHSCWVWLDFVSSFQCIWHEKACFQIQRTQIHSNYFDIKIPPKNFSTKSPYESCHALCLMKF